MTSRRVPLRHSLVVRLLVTSIVVAVLAVVATAWLATRTATQAIRQEQGRSLADEKALYDAVVGYAAQHREWSGVGELLEEQAQKLNRRIILTDKDRRPLAVSSPGPALAAGTRPSATVDAMDIDLALTGGTDRIDARVVGPYRLTPKEGRRARKNAEQTLACLLRAGLNAEIVEAPSGRPTAQVTGPADASLVSQCADFSPSPLVRSERRALKELLRRTADCLDVPAAQLGSGQKFTRQSSPMFDAADWFKSPASISETRKCVEVARGEQLRPYTAPPALLFVTDPDTGRARTTFTLSRPNIIRIVAVTGGVLLATMLVTVLAGRRLVRPLRALTEGAARQEPVDIRTRDEIGYLASALNEATGRRDRAESLRRAMVGDVAHELRNPLTNIRSWLEAAQDGLTPTDRALVDLLHDEALLLQHVIDDLADLAAADAGTLRLHPEPVDLRDVLDQVLDAHLSPAQGVLLRAEGPHLDLTADPRRLRQLVGNLVSNAVRYTPPGGSVTLTAAPGPSSVRITVQDTGIGIAPEHLPKVFDRFWRADDSRTRGTGGSGLGLAIARQIAEAHGGAITVDSALGRGTTFTVVLPVHA